MFQVIREYATGRLNTDTFADEVRCRHARHFADTQHSRAGTVFWSFRRAGSDRAACSG
jgi:hypothetical protein